VGAAFLPGWAGAAAASPAGGGALEGPSLWTPPGSATAGPPTAPGSPPRPPEAGPGAAAPPILKTAGRRRRRWPWILAAIVLVLGSVAAIFGPSMLRTPTYVVPNLQGRRADETVAHPPPHFRVVRHDVRVTGAPKDTILSQTPRADTRHAAGTITVDASIGNRLVPVPGLGGLTVDDATSQLQAVDLVAGKPAHQFSASVPAGGIIDWTPRDQAEEQSTVNLVVSDGPQVVTMPDVTTKKSDAAVQAVVAAGLAADRITQTQDYSDTVPAGSVISSTPPPGGQLDRAGSASLVVSKGPQMVQVPDVTGLPASQAQAKLAAVGLGADVVSPLGGSTVVYQRPTGGSTVKHGSKITLITA